MKNNATRTIRSEEITIDVRICAALAANRGGEVYLAAIAPDMELTVITLDEAPDILPCFEEDDACLNLPNTSLLLCYNPAQVRFAASAAQIRTSMVIFSERMVQVALFFIGVSPFVCKRKRPHRVFRYGISQRSFCRCCLRCHCSSSLMMVSSICLGV